MASTRARTHTVVAGVAAPQIRDGVTQTDIEQYGIACFQKGKAAARAEARAEQKRRADDAAALAADVLELADALRDSGMDEEQVRDATLRVVGTGRWNRR